MQASFASLMNCNLKYKFPQSLLDKNYLYLVLFIQHLLFHLKGKIHSISSEEYTFILILNYELQIISIMQYQVANFLINVFYACI